MKVFHMLAVAVGTMILGVGAVAAQEMTIEGAKVLLSTVPGTEGCAKPSAAPVIPDGSKVSEQGIKDAISAFQTYMADSETYRLCLDKVASDAGDSLTDQQNQAVTMVYDDNAAGVEALGAKMNEQIRAYNAAHPSK